MQINVMNSHLVNKLLKRSRLKKTKQQLCDRINQCKSLEELKGWERTFSYHPVLKDDQDWDYGFFLDLIEFKLKRMREYFWTHNIVENEKKYGDICNRLINILNAGYKTDIILEKDLHTKVNTRNVYRFFNPEQLNFIMKEGLQQYYLPTIREVKSKKLFWTYLEHHIEKLWD
jgi:hypothetical protein